MALNRAKLIHDAQETVAALNSGGFSVGSEWVDLTPSLERMKAESRCYSPSELDALPILPGRFETRIEVTPETTLSAVQRLLGEYPEPVAALNFASGSEPGGGFLVGSAAQEESLARASGLYAALSLHPEFYAPTHWQRHLYSDQLIFTPDVPVFRGEDGGWLTEPYFMHVLTAAAPNLRHFSSEVLRELQLEVRPVLEGRIHKVLALLQAQGCRRVVLGAWGCGAFRNDPDMVAAIFGTVLEGPFAGAFEQVTFAVFAMDWEAENLWAFRERFT